MSSSEGPRDGYEFLADEGGEDAVGRRGTIKKIGFKIVGGYRTLRQHVRNTERNQTKAIKNVFSGTNDKEDIAKIIAIGQAMGSVQKEELDSVEETRELDPAMRSTEEELQGPKDLHDLFRTHDLVVHLLQGRRILGVRMDGLSNPYVKINVGSESYRCQAVRSTLDPLWNSMITVPGDLLVKEKFRLRLETWSWDPVIPPDSFCGEVKVDLGRMPTSALLKSVPDTHILKQAVVKRHGHVEQGDFGELHVKFSAVARASNRRLAPAGLSGSQLVGDCDPMLFKRLQPCMFSNKMGTLFEEPCFMYIRVAVEDVLSAVTLPDAMAVVKEQGLFNIQPSSSKGGKTNALRARLKQLRHTGKATIGKARVPIEPGTEASILHSNTGFLADLFSGVSVSPEVGGDKFDTSETSVSDVEGRDVATAEPDTGESVSDNEEMHEVDHHGADEYEDAQSDEEEDSVDEHELPEMYMYCVLKFHKQQSTTKLRRLDVSTGRCSVNQKSVFAVQRPIRSCPLEIRFYTTSNKKAAGSLAGLFQADIVDLLKSHQDADRLVDLRVGSHRLCESTDAAFTVRGSRKENDGKRTRNENKVFKKVIEMPTVAPEFNLPVLDWPLEFPLSGSVSLHVGASDADFRPQIYNIPLFHEKGQLPQASQESSLSSTVRVDPCERAQSAVGRAAATVSTAIATVTEPVMSAAVPGKSAQDWVAAVAKPIQSAAEPVQSATVSCKSAQDWVAVAAEPIKTAQNWLAAVAEPIKSATEPIRSAKDWISQPKSWMGGSDSPPANAAPSCGTKEEKDSVPVNLGKKLAQAMLPDWAAELSQTSNKSRAQAYAKGPPEKDDLTDPLNYQSGDRTPQLPVTATCEDDAVPSPRSMNPVNLEKRQVSSRASSMATFLSCTHRILSLLVRLTLVLWAALRAALRLAWNTSKRLYQMRFGQESIRNLYQSWMKASPDKPADSPRGAASAVLPTKPKAKSNWHGAVPADHFHTLPDHVPESWQYNKHEPSKKVKMLPIGTVKMRVDSIYCNLPNLHVFAIFKLGPVWIRTASRSTGTFTSDMGWEYEIPIYRPSEPMVSALFYHASAKPKPSDIKLFMFAKSPISVLPPNRDILRKQVFCMHSIAADAKRESRLHTRDTMSHAAAKAAKLAVSPGEWFHEKGEGKEVPVIAGWEPAEITAANKRANGKPYILVVSRTCVSYTSMSALPLSYKQPLRPPEWYTLDMDEHLMMIEKQHRKIMSRWFAAAPETACVPPSCVACCMATPREKFSLDIFKHNLERVKRSISNIVALLHNVKLIKTWKNPAFSIWSIILCAFFCFQPSATVAGILVHWMLCIYDNRRLVGMPLDAYLPQSSEETSEDADAPVSTKYAELKRQYHGVVGIALDIQNVLDDIATFFERLEAINKWHDPVASMILIVVLAAVSVAIYLFGLPILLTLVIAYVLRPPQYRDPEPTPPEAYFSHLPAQRNLIPREKEDTLEMSIR